MASLSAATGLGLGVISKEPQVTSPRFTRPFESWGGSFRLPFDREPFTWSARLEEAGGFVMAVVFGRKLSG